MSEKSHLLIAGNNKLILDLLKRVTAHYEQKNHDQWKEEIETLTKTWDSTSAIPEPLELDSRLHLSNKYFSSELLVSVFPCAASAPSPANYETFDGVITFCSGEIPPATSWQCHGEMETVVFRQACIDTNPDTFDLESHLNAQPSFTETLVGDFSADDASAKWPSDMDKGWDRVLEGLGETMWKGYVQKDEKSKKSGHHAVEAKDGGYMQVVDQEDGEGKDSAAAVAPSKNTEKPQVVPTANIDKNKDGFVDGVPMEGFEDGLEDDMKIFEEIMAFKAISNGMSQAERKQMADKIFSKLAGMYDDL